MGQGPLFEKMNSEVVITLIYDALYRLGFKAKHSGFFYLSYSVLLCVDAGTDQIPDERLHAEVARHYRTSPEIVGARIHAAILNVWKTDRDRMQVMMERRSGRRPSDREILAYLYRYITGQHLKGQA